MNTVKSTHNVKNINEDIIQDVLMYVISFLSRSSFPHSLKHSNSDSNTFLWWFHTFSSLLCPFFLLALFYAYVYCSHHRQTRLQFHYEVKMEKQEEEKTTKLTGEMIITQTTRKKYNLCHFFFAAFVSLLFLSALTHLCH